MVRVIIKQEDNSIMCEFNEMCDALKYTETTLEVCEHVSVTIEEEVD